MALDFTSLEVFLLVKDSVNSDGSFACLPISDNKLTLSSANRHKAIDGLKSTLHRFVDGFTGNNSWCLDFNSLTLAGVDWAESIDGVSECIEHSTKHLFADGDVDDCSGPCDCIAFLNVTIVSENDDTHVVCLKVKGHASYS